MSRNKLTVLVPTILAIEISLTIAFDSTYSLITLVAEGKPDNNACQNDHGRNDHIRHVKQHPGTG